MGRIFIAYDPELTREYFSSDIVVSVYYKKLLNYSDLLEKDDQGYFTVTSKKIEAATCITRRAQERARQWLERQGVIAVALKSPDGKVPQQLHYRIIDRIT